MGLLDRLRTNMPGGPKSIAQHLLKYYLSDVAKFPHSPAKAIFKKMLHDRYAIFKVMKESDIDRVVAQADTLVELTLLVIANEHKAAVSEHYFR